jgi:hypothetical protein
MCQNTSCFEQEVWLKEESFVWIVAMEKLSHRVKSGNLGEIEHID